MRLCAALLVASSSLACGRGADAPSSEPTDPERIAALVFTRAVGAQHDSAPDVLRFFGELERAVGVDVTLTEDARRFSDESLRGFAVVVFVNTSGDVLDEAQQAALTRFVQSGRGFVGVHGAADTEHDWPWYGALLGASASSSAEVSSEAFLGVEPTDHPSSAAFPSKFHFLDEWLEFDRNPRETATVTLSANEPTAKPLAWFKHHEGGRAFYTSLGHRSETWHDARFQTHLLEGIRWAARGDGFGTTVLTRATRNPVALAVTPTGDVYYIERTGEVRLWSRRTGSVTDALVLQVDTAYENGLLGIALDPAFDDNGFVYLYASEPLSGLEGTLGPPGRNVLQRFTAQRDGSLERATRVELLSVPSERRCCHEGGALAFTSDGDLLLSTGDNTNPFDAAGFAPLDVRPGRERFDSQRTAANPFDLRGKILRLKPDGSPADGNLFSDDSARGLPEIYAMGVRNPFRIASDPSAPRVFFGDVGPDAIQDGERGPRGYDELNLLSAPADFGWPHCMAHNSPYHQVDFASGQVFAAFDCSGRAPALLAYDYATRSYPALGIGLSALGDVIGRTVVAGAVYRAPRTAPFALPARFDGALLLADWSRNLVAAVHTDAAGALLGVERFLASEDFRRPIDLEVGSDGAIYVLEYGSGFWGDNGDAGLRRIEFGPSRSLSPSARIDASPTFGAAPLRVHLSAERSRAFGPEQRLSEYAWDLDQDALPDVFGAEVDVSLDRPGEHRISLVVTSSSGKRSLPVAERIVVGNAPPSVRVLAPSRGERFPVGASVTLLGEASDPEDGIAACAELVWNVSLVHDAHAHPAATLHGCQTSFVADAAEHAGAEVDLSYAIELVYTDHGGPTGEPPLTARQGIQVEVSR